MGRRADCCLLLVGILSLVKASPAVHAEPGVFRDDTLILGDMDIASNCIYKLACQVSEATMEHTISMNVTINGRQRLTPSPSVSNYTNSVYSASLHRDFFLYTTDNVTVTCTARYTDGTVKTTLRTTPEGVTRETRVEDSAQHNNPKLTATTTMPRKLDGNILSDAKANNHHHHMARRRCRQMRRAVRNRQVEPWAGGPQGTGNLTDKDLLKEMSRVRQRAAWKVMKLAKRHLCPDDKRRHIGDNVQSVEGSVEHSRNVSHSTVPLGPQEQAYIKKSREVWDKLWEMYQTTDAWELESGSDHTTPEQGCVHSRTFTGIGKVYRLQGYVDGSPELLFNELVTRVTDTPTWSSTVLECRVLQHLDDTTNILYTIAAEAGGGFVSSRDFVNLNHYASKDGVMVSSASSVTHPDMPASPDHVRGESGPGGYIFKPVPGNPNKCLLIQMINTDLKGWIPQYVVDQALSGVLIQYHKDVQTRIAQVQSSRPSL